MPSGGVLINWVIADLPKIISATYFSVKKNPEQQRKFWSYFKFPLVHLPHPSPGNTWLQGCVLTQAG